ncbi:MAG: hypothetical protein R3D71_07460 [Rickettsiales bacterium]
MSFKIHLIVVVIISLVLLLAAKMIVPAPEQNTPTPVNNPTSLSPYKIVIERASWGLNCLKSKLYQKQNNTENSYNYYDDSNDKGNRKENNVLYRVSQLCNGKSKCDFPINTYNLGEDPFPTCGYKILHVEYRCFEIDRLRVLETKNNQLNIDCDAMLGDHP